MTKEERIKAAEAAIPNSTYPSGYLYSNGFVCDMRRAAFIAGAEAEAESNQKIMNDILRLNNPWPLIEVMKKLVEASDILLHQKDYDRLGWEDHEYCYREGLKIIEILDKPLNQQ